MRPSPLEREMFVAVPLYGDVRAAVVKPGWVWWNWIPVSGLSLSHLVYVACTQIHPGLIKHGASCGVFNNDVKNASQKSK